MIATCIYEPGSGDITSLAVSRKHRRKGLGTSLLNAVIRDISSDVVKVINIPTDEEGIVSFLSACGMPPTGKQFEMLREIF
ncbi:MAG: GNAT family N-acetyltransferase [Bacteroidales bacterium]